jgi:hypothetical protein
MFQQMAHMIIPEQRSHLSEYFVLNYAQSHVLWKWQNTITRQALFEDLKNLNFLRDHNYLQNFYYATPPELRKTPNLRKMIHNAPVWYREEILLGVNPFGFVVNVDAVKIRNRNLSYAMDLCGKMCREFDQHCAKNGIEFSIPKPFKPAITLVVEDEVTEQSKVVVVESSDDDVEENEPLTFDGFLLQGRP